MPIPHWDDDESDWIDVEEARAERRDRAYAQHECPECGVVGGHNEGCPANDADDSEGGSL